jgi:hypothetical protein
VSNVKWLSKAVNIILIPSLSSSSARNNSAYSEVLEEASALQNSRTRNAFVINLFRCSDDDSSHSSNGPLKIAESWSRIDVSFIGANGVLPNMDAVSALYAMFGPSINLYSSSEGTYEGVCSHGTRACGLLWSVLNKSSLIKYIGEKSLLFEYLRRLDAFWQSMWETAMIGPSAGLHAQYLRRNMEALTLIPRHNGDGPLQKASKGKVDMQELVSVVVSLVRLASNLHGKRAACC